MVSSQFWTALVVVLIVGAVGVYVGQMVGTSKTSQVAAVASPTTDSQKIAVAMMAAPSDITADATIMDFPSGTSTELRLLREGENDWTCLPDDPRSPVVDPICVDKVALEWFGSYMAQETPRITQIGYGYMLLGGATASNDDPFAAAPEPGEDWTNEPPHIMVFSPVPPDAAVYGTAMTGGPWVMWANTPYAHLMVPVENMAMTH